MSGSRWVPAWYGLAAGINAVSAYLLIDHGSRVAGGVYLVAALVWAAGMGVEIAGSTMIAPRHNSQSAGRSG